GRPDFLSILKLRLLRRQGQDYFFNTQLFEACANKNRMNARRYLEIGGAFGVLRLDAAFSAFALANVPPKFNASLTKAKLRKRCREDSAGEFRFRSAIGAVCL